MKLALNNLSTRHKLIDGKKVYDCVAVDDFVALDIETTGLSPVYNEIINIGAIRFRENRPVDQIDFLIKPQKRIPIFITSLTGISNLMVQDAPSIEEVLPRVMEFIGNDVIVGHNVNFDISFINNALIKHGYNNFLTTYIDTMLMARSFRKNNSLENLVRDYVNKDYVEKHMGLDDAMNTARVFYVFKRLFANR